MRTGFGVQGGLAGVDLLHELDDAVLVEEDLGLRRGRALVGEGDLEAGVEEGQLAQALGDGVGLEDGRVAEDLGVGLEGDERAGALGFADDLEFLDGLAALELHVVDRAAAGDLDLEPLGDGVDALGADAVRAAGEFVAALAVFAAGVQRGEHELDARQAGILVDVHRDAAAVVADGSSRPREWRPRSWNSGRRDVRPRSCRGPRKRSGAGRARRCRRYTCRASCGRPPGPSIGPVYSRRSQRRRRWIWRAWRLLRRRTFRAKMS
jgi:hypothetical protein